MAREVETQAAGPSPGKRMTYGEFLAWADEDTFAEWINGEVLMMSPAADWHQDVADFLTALFRFFAEARKLGRVFSAPFQMKPAPELPGREPDVLFVAQEHLDRLKTSYLDGPADLVVEVISPDSRSRDRGDKYYEYEEGGVREYWLIDCLRKQAEFYLRGADGIFRMAAVADDGIYRSIVLDGLWLRVDWLWRNPLPPLVSVLKEWGLV